MNIPEKLYRGDADQDNIRELKQTLHFGQMQTNLLKGGNGHAIFDTPIINLIAAHVDSGWVKTHFLSFSEDENTAKRFALHCELQDVEYKMMEYAEYYEQEKDWDFALIEIDTRLVKWEKLDIGIYIGKHEPSLNKFIVFPGMCTVILINVHQAISAYPNFSNYWQVLANSERDREWLLLPATPVNLQGKIEYSGIFDGKIIEEFKKYKKL